jgi:F-type H+-transporting ATPase subunit delta
LSLQTIARRYATALADIVTERGEAAAVLKELSDWERMIAENANLREVFANPTISYEQKRKVLNELISRTRVRPTTANFLQVLLKNQRLTELAEINRKFAEVLDERSGVVAAEVVTAHPVPDNVKQAIHSRLKALTGKEVRLNFETNDVIIGGLVTRIGSTVYDGSIKTQLELLATRLARS